MDKSFTGRKRIRKSFGRISEVAPLPNLIEVQKNSYDKFLQTGISQEQRDDAGLQEVFKSVFPIKDFSERATLEFVSYELEQPKYDTEECRQRGMTFAAPLRVTLRLVVWDIDEDTGARSIRDIKEQDVYMGDMPLMTEHGTFIVNGTERVIVSQMHRSPVSSSTMTRARATARANTCLPHVSFRIVVPGSISNSMQKTSCMSVSTVAANCRRPRC